MSTAKEFKQQQQTMKHETQHQNPKVGLDVQLRAAMGPTGGRLWCNPYLLQDNARKSMAFAQASQTFTLIAAALHRMFRISNQ